MEENEKKDEATETSVEPTAHLRHGKDGELQQLVRVSYSDGSSRPEWRALPSEE